MTISNCYASGVVVGNGDSKPFHEGAKHESCYFNSDLFSGSGKDGVSGLSTADFADSSKFAGWDFQNTWYIDSKTGYPELKFN